MSDCGIHVVYLVAGWGLPDPLVLCSCGTVLRGVCGQITAVSREVHSVHSLCWHNIQCYCFPKLWP